MSNLITAALFYEGGFIGSFEGNEELKEELDGQRLLIDPEDYDSEGVFTITPEVGKEFKFTKKDLLKRGTAWVLRQIDLGELDYDDIPQWSVIVDPGYRRIKYTGMTRAEAVEEAKFRVSHDGGGYPEAAVISPDGERVDAYYSY